MKKIAFHQIPEDILNNEKLNAALKIFPSNYNFEIHKTIWKIRKTSCKRGWKNISIDSMQSEVITLIALKLITIIITV